MAEHPVEGLAAGASNVLFEVWLLSRATTGVLDAALVDVGITADEFAVYSVLTASDVMTPTELARWMSAPATTVSSVVKRLEGRGHLRRARHPSDGRSSVLQLTTAGRATHRAATKAFVPVLADVLDDLGTKEPSVRRALAALRDAIEEAATRRAER